MEKSLLIVLFIAILYYPLCGIVGFIEFVKDRTGNDCDTQDMFDLEEIREIAEYLMVYYNTHQNGD